MGGGSWGAGAEQDVEGESAAVRRGGAVETVNDPFGAVDEAHHFRASECRFRVVVGVVALELHNYEYVPEVSYFRRKPAHNPSVEALVFGVTVFHGPVSLHPKLPIAGGRPGPGKHIGGVARQQVKQGVIGGAYGAAQFGLPGPPPSPANGAGRQLPRDPNKIARIHCT